MKNLAVKELQKDVCRRFKADYVPSPGERKLGIALNIKDGIEPINGLRHPVEADTTGWYIWTGEVLSNDSEFFRPLHVDHLDEWCPRVKKYLGLAPGWRFLIHGDYEDVWFDENLLSDP